MFIHSACKLSMISVWQVKMEAFLFYSKSQKSKQAIFLMTNLLLKVNVCCVVLPTKEQNAEKMLNSFLKIFLQKYRPNHVWYSITRTKHKDWHRFDFEYFLDASEYFLDASDIYRVQVIFLSMRYSGLDHCLKMCRSLFYIRVIN